MEFPLRYLGLIGIKRTTILLFIKNCKSLSFLQGYPVGSRYNYIPDDAGEVSWNTNLDKLPTKPKKSLFIQSAFLGVDGFSLGKRIEM